MSPEKRLIVPGDDAQRLEITGAGRFHVEAAVRRAGQDWIQRELVGARMQAQFVRTKLAGQRGVIGERPLQFADVALVVDALFEFADESWARC